MLMESAYWDTYNILPSEFRYIGASKSRIREVVYPIATEIKSDYEDILLNELKYASEHMNLKCHQNTFQVYLVELMCIKRSALVDKNVGGTYVHTKYHVKDNKDVRKMLISLSRMAFCS